MRASISCSKNDRCPGITVYCLRVTDFDFSLKCADVRPEWPQEVWHGVWWEDLERRWRYHLEPSLLLSSVSLYIPSQSSHLAWPLVNPGLHQWFILSVAAIKFMICQFKIVNGNMDFLQRLNNWVIHTSSISGYLAWEGGVSEARGRGMWRCNYQSFSLNKWQWEVGGVVRRKVLLLVVSSVGLFLSYQWWPTLGEGESFLFTSHTMLLSPCYKCYMFHVLSEFRSDKFQNKQI